MIKEADLAGLEQDEIKFIYADVIMNSKPIDLEFNLMEAFRALHLSFRPYNITAAREVFEQITDEDVLHRQGSLALVLGVVGASLLTCNKLLPPKKKKLHDFIFEQIDIFEQNPKFSYSSRRALEKAKKIKAGKQNVVSDKNAPKCLTSGEDGGYSGKMGRVRIKVAP
jgi:hypothetical protein